MPRTGNFESFNAVLPRFLGSIKSKKKYSEQQVFYHWDKIVGKDIARHVRPERFSFKTLFLAADSPVWANQLLFLQEEIIDKINQFLQEKLVKELRFNASLSPFKKSIEKKDISKSEKINLIPTDEEKSKSAEVCKKVHNQDLQKVLSSAVAANLAKRRWRLENGWHKCADCQTLVEPAEKLCSECQRKAVQSRAKKIREFLLACPWSKYADIYNYVPCTAAEANSERAKLLQQLAGRIVYGDKESLEMKTLVMLADSLPYEKITTERIERVMKRFRWMMINKEKDDKKDKGEF